ncbi:MAG: hypothetical protein WCK85_11705 [Chlorobium sp.]
MNARLYLPTKNQKNAAGIYEEENLHLGVLAFLYPCCCLVQKVIADQLVKKNTRAAAIPALLHEVSLLYGCVAEQAPAWMSEKKLY